MLIRTLKNYQPINFILFLAISILVWIKPLINADQPGIYIDPNPMPFYAWIVGLIGSPQLNILGKLLAFVLVLLQAILINGITNQYNLLGFRGYLPGIFFMLICTIFPDYQILHPILFANLFLLFAWERVIRAYEKENTFEAYFNASFLIGLASLFYPNYTYFLLILLISVGMNRVGHLREFALVLVGFLAVWYFYLGIYYVLTSSIQFSGLENDFSFSFPKYPQIIISQKVILIFSSILLLMASFQLGGYISNLKIPMRRNLKFLFLWFWLGIFILLFTKSSIEIIYIVSIPTAVLFSIFFANFKKTWVRETLWISFLLFIVLNQLLPYFIILN